MMPSNAVEMKLPPLTKDMAEAKKHIDQYGCALIQDALTGEQLVQARERLMEQAAGEQKAGIATRDGGPGRPNQRLWNLLNKGQIFREMVVAPFAKKLIGHILGPRPMLSSLTANIAHPGGEPMPVHSDQGYVPLEIPIPMVANIMWMLDEFTEENGGTRIVPGSHKGGKNPDFKNRPQTIAVEGPAGTAMVFDGRLWHGTGANTSQKSRHGILSYFCRPFMRQQENHTVSVSPEVLKTASPELLALIGFESWFSLGGIDGVRMHGTLAPRPDKFSTELGG